MVCIRSFLYYLLSKVCWNMCYVPIMHFCGTICQGIATSASWWLLPCRSSYTKVGSVMRFKSVSWITVQDWVQEAWETAIMCSAFLVRVLFPSFCTFMCKMNSHKFDQYCFLWRTLFLFKLCKHSLSQASWPAPGCNLVLPIMASWMAAFQAPRC